LEERRMRLLYDASRTGAAGTRGNFVHPDDTGGVLIELVQAAAAEERTEAPHT
jgi:methylmalonyl-CoA/ethylmalonyl-CoA epimerase